MDTLVTEKIYVYIRDYIQQHGFPPSQREIADACFVSVSALVRHLDRLEHQGRISRELGKARSINILR
jgi:repressor LexA